MASRSRPANCCGADCPRLRSAGAQPCLRVYVDCQSRRRLVSLEEAENQTSLHRCIASSKETRNTPRSLILRRVWLVTSHQQCQDFGSRSKQFKTCSVTPRKTKKQQTRIMAFFSRTLADHTAVSTLHTSCILYGARYATEHSSINNRNTKTRWTRSFVPNHHAAVPGRYTPCRNTTMFDATERAIHCVWRHARSANSA